MKQGTAKKYKVVRVFQSGPLHHACAWDDGRGIAASVDRSDAFMMDLIERRRTDASPEC